MSDLELEQPRTELDVLESMNDHLRMIRQHLSFVALAAVIALILLVLWLTGVIEVGFKPAHSF